MVDVDDAGWTWSSYQAPVAPVARGAYGYTCGVYLPGAADAAAPARRPAPPAPPAALPHVSARWVTEALYSNGALSAESGVIVRSVDECSSTDGGDTYTLRVTYGGARAAAVAEDTLPTTLTLAVIDSAADTSAQDQLRAWRGRGEGCLWAAACEDVGLQSRETEYLSLKDWLESEKWCDLAPKPEPEEGAEGEGTDEDEDEEDEEKEEEEAEEEEEEEEDEDGSTPLERWAKKLRGLLVPNANALDNVTDEDIMAIAPKTKAQVMVEQSAKFRTRQAVAAALFFSV